MYPNPVKAGAPFYLQDIHPGANVFITNPAGKVIHCNSQDKTKRIIQTHKFVPGVYIIRINTGNRKQIFKLIVI